MSIADTTLGDIFNMDYTPEDGIVPVLINQWMVLPLWMKCWKLSVNSAAAN
ncbi:hypothetical protein [Xenorhabdus sp. SGI246]|uniref:hypothetical protein n=1 Tax=Xenorhabdus sp. SGI246 TaxID=3158263 RepID=UPI00349FBA48